jgi:hypothetical protein
MVYRVNSDNSGRVAGIAYYGQPIAEIICPQRMIWLARRP